MEQLQLGFNGEVTDPSNHNDINVNKVPKGGVIVSVGSKEWIWIPTISWCRRNCSCFCSRNNYQISIGNTGSGYRSGLQTVSVGIQTASYGTANITAIGVATVVDGHVVGVAITNSKVFYAPREISNIGYSSITGITTVTTATPHNLQLGMKFRLLVQRLLVIITHQLTLQTLCMILQQVS